MEASHERLVTVRPTQFPLWKRGHKASIRLFCSIYWKISIPACIPAASGSKGIFSVGMSPRRVYTSLCTYGTYSSWVLPVSPMFWTLRSSSAWRTTWNATSQSKISHKTTQLLLPESTKVAAGARAEIFAAVKLCKKTGRRLGSYKCWQEKKNTHTSFVLTPNCQDPFFHLFFLLLLKGLRLLCPQIPFHPYLVFLQKQYISGKRCPRWVPRALLPGSSSALHLSRPEQGAPRWRPGLASFLHFPIKSSMFDVVCSFYSQLRCWKGTRV